MRCRGEPRKRWGSSALYLLCEEAAQALITPFGLILYRKVESIDTFSGRSGARAGIISRANGQVPCSAAEDVQQLILSSFRVADRAGS